MNITIRPLQIQYFVFRPTYHLSVTFFNLNMVQMNIRAAAILCLAVVAPALASPVIEG